MLDDVPECWDETDAWVDAARVAARMEGNRLGLMGNYYGEMLDIYSNVNRQCATFRHSYRNARGGSVGLTPPRS